MLLRSLASSSSVRVRHHAPTVARRRHYVVQSLADGFLNLANALPYPPSFPPYATTIIVVTIISRFAILPVSIWAKRRQIRLEERVLPAVQQNAPLIHQKVFAEMRANGVKGSLEEIKIYHERRSRELLTEFQKVLLDKYHCRPRPTILAPLLTQVPIFVLGSIVFARVASVPTPLDAESFLTLTTLAHPDPTMTLPILLGVITMANVESSNWMMNAAERERERAVIEKRDRKVAEGAKPTFRPKELIKTAMRALAVVRIIFAAVMPGSVAIYWTTSATFGLLQTWAFDWADVQRRRRRGQLEASPAVVPIVETTTVKAPSQVVASKASKKVANVGNTNKTKTATPKSKKKSSKP